MNFLSIKTVKIQNPLAFFWVNPQNNLRGVKMIINRDYDLQQLINAKHKGMIKVITGLRRSDKSFLLFELFDKNQYQLSTKISL